MSSKQPNGRDAIGKVLNFQNKKRKFEIINCNSSAYLNTGHTFTCRCIESEYVEMLGKEFHYSSRAWSDEANNNIVLEEKEILEEFNWSISDADISLVLLEMDLPDGEDEIEEARGCLNEDEIEEEASKGVNIDEQILFAQCAITIQIEQYLEEEQNERNY